MDYEVTYTAAMEREGIRAQQRPPDPPPVYVKLPRVLRTVPAPKRPSARGLIRDLLKQGGWFSAKDIAERVELHLSSTYDAVMRMKAAGQVQAERDTVGRRREPQRYRWKAV